jgi:hypothetical protein
MPSIFSRLALAALFVVPVAAFASKPAVPAVTVGAAGIKQFQFDVSPVAGASYYELWFLPNGGASWVKYMTTLDADPLFKVTVSAHLLDWHNARYRVTACNSEGCSSTAKIAVTNLMEDTVGYFKPRAAKVSPVGYGRSVTVSADGKTMAVLTGETIGPHPQSAAVYVYEKANSGWRRTARLLPTTVLDYTAYPQSSSTPRELSINDDGTAIALGVPIELLPGSSRGAIYVFRKSGTTWSLEQKIGSSAVDRDELGLIVKLDAQGQSLAAWRDNAADPGVAPKPSVEIYHHGAGGWTQAQRIAPAAGVMNFDMSRDGKVVAVMNTDYSADVYSGANFASRQALMRMDIRSIRLKTIATNVDGSVIAVQTVHGPVPAGQTWQPLVMAFRRGSSGWIAEPAFTYIGGNRGVPFGGGSPEFASALAISDDGKFIALGDPRACHAGTGALYPPVTAGHCGYDANEEGGALYVFQRKPSSWALRNLIVPNVAKGFTGFASALAFGDNNRVLAVGAREDSSGARDIDGDPNDTSGRHTGAVWLY